MKGLRGYCLQTGVSPWQWEYTTAVTPYSSAISVNGRGFLQNIGGRIMQKHNELSISGFLLPCERIPASGPSPGQPVSSPAPPALHPSRLHFPSGPDKMVPQRYIPSFQPGHNPDIPQNYSAGKTIFPANSSFSRWVFFASQNISWFPRSKILCPGRLRDKSQIFPASPTAFFPRNDRR